MGRNNARAVKSATVVIFEDPKRRVMRLLESLTTITEQCGHVGLLCFKESKNYFPNLWKKVNESS